MDAMKTGARTRAMAAEAVDAVVRGGRSLETALAGVENRISASERSLLRALCYGALRKHHRLRWQLRRLLGRPVKPRDSVIESLLAVGIYQLTDTRVPDHAAVSMTVEAARALRRPKHAALVNAVLRNFLRRNLKAEEPDEDEARHSHPAWMLERFRRQWPDHWPAVVDAGNRQPPMWLRVNTRRQPLESYLEELRNSDRSEGPRPSHEVSPGFDQALKLGNPRLVAELPGFAEGRVSVQDAAAQLAAPWLLRDGGLRILDACAAPGGKTGHLLELAAADAVLTAVDLDQDRTNRLRENIERLGLPAKVITADASRPDEWWDGTKFDRILLDAPCSATGVIRRHPDIKLLRREDDVTALAQTQKALLRALWPLLERQGRLLYVTCSVLEDENDAVVGDFLARRADAGENDMLLNRNIRDLMQRTRYGYQILPGSRDMDGFYFSCLENVG